MHGGNLRELAVEAGKQPGEILDFSASINPLGPPHWLASVLSRSLESISHYPDPAATLLRQAIADKHGVTSDHVVVGNGSSELLAAIARTLPGDRHVTCDPSYTGYDRAARAGGRTRHSLPLTSPHFDVDGDALERSCCVDSVVVLGHPNNPTGRILSEETIARCAERHPRTQFIIDESFLEFVRQDTSCFTTARPNVVVVRSMTKFYAIPGLRLGYALAAPETAAGLRDQLPEWPVNAIALEVGRRCLQDDHYADRTRSQVSRWRSQLAVELAQLPLDIVPGEANFLLCRLQTPGIDAATLAGRLLRDSAIAIRTCSDFVGLDDRYFRVAVRTPEENARLLEALRCVLQPHRRKTPSRPPRRAPALMIQGVSSNAGKSLIAAALCRILAQDGVRVAPFKSQNMSLNSFVTRAGHEISRAQVVQAQACGLDPEVRMNPVLLKPNSHTGSQVIVDGKPVGNMKVREYYAYKQQAFERAKLAYDSLAGEFQAIVLEGAGSPGEVNLKQHDIVNMTMARHAGASVLLVGDIDRGGVFASFVGTLAVLEPWERQLVAGYLVNRFRGDAGLLEDAYTYMLEHTGKAVLGTIPNIDDPGIPDEDSVSFKRGETPQRSGTGHRRLDIVLIDLPHLSNLSDFDALRSEPDVHLRVVRRADELGTPDAVILPGTRNTIADLHDLKAREFESALMTAAANGHTEVIGICGGLQMLGHGISDPERMESTLGQSAGFGLLDVTTELSREKTLRQVEAVHPDSQQVVSGYEIHHGTTCLGESPVALEPTEFPVTIAGSSERIWGTYLHGIFDQDGFRRWFLDRLRGRKGLQPLADQAGRYDLNSAFDRLAEVVRHSVDMDAIYRLLRL